MKLSGQLIYVNRDLDVVVDDIPEKAECCISNSEAAKQGSITWQNRQIPILHQYFHITNKSSERSSERN